ncbi:alpha/beta hydrolase family protein [Microbacterium bovistercoris]|nr:prolyl oligopeptidase family serine peptidase [Microbacterium bovistercoris]
MLRIARRLFLTLLAALAVTLPLGSAPAPAAAQAHTGYLTESVGFVNDGEHLSGTVLVPASPGPHPAVVIIAGAGPRTRDEYLAEAKAFATAGIVTLIYDKRRDGYSMLERSYEQLADDAAAGLRALTGRDDVDPARAGVWGHSEGGWVAPLAAARHPEIRFVVMTGASGFTPAESQAWSNCEYLGHTGFAARFCTALGENVVRIAVATGLFPEAMHDPVPLLRRLEVPALVLLAEHDRSTPAGASARVFESELAADSRACTVPDVDHEFRDSADGFASGDLAEEPLRFTAQWMTDHARASSCPWEAPAAAADVVPTLAPQSAPLLPIGLLLAALSGFAAYPLTALIRRFRGVRGRPPLAVPLRVATASGALGAMGAVLVAGWVLATGAEGSLGPVVAERPLAWLLLQLAVVTALAAAAVAVAGWVRRPLHGWGAVRAAIVIACTGLLAIAAVPWGLLTL